MEKSERLDFPLGCFDTKEEKLWQDKELRCNAIAAFKTKQKKTAVVT